MVGFVPCCDVGNAVCVCVCGGGGGGGVEGAEKGSCERML